MQERPTAAEQALVARIACPVLSAGRLWVTDINPCNISWVGGS